MKKKLISYFFDSFTSGILLAIGCTVYLMCENKLVGSFLFGLGLLTIVTFKLGLYTGKVGYVPMRPASYVIEVLVTLIGNICGTAFGGLIINLTKLGSLLNTNASNIIFSKTADSPLSACLLGALCGILMFIAVDGRRRLSEKGDFVGSFLILVMPIMIFIICGFNHSIADFAYFFISRCAYTKAFLFYVIFVIAGNAFGCMLIPLLKKLSINKL